MGPFTPLLSRLVGMEGLVHTVEPNPSVIHRLHAQLALNRIENVVVHQVAVGPPEAAGGFVFIPPARGRSGSTSIQTHAGGRQAAAHALPPNCSTATTVASCIDSNGRLRQYTRVVTLDSLRVPNLSLLKLDMCRQGLEPQPDSPTRKSRVWAASQRGRRMGRASGGQRHAAQISASRVRGGAQESC